MKKKPKKQTTFLAIFNGKMFVPVHVSLEIFIQKG